MNNFHHIRFLFFLSRTYQHIALSPHQEKREGIPMFFYLIHISTQPTTSTL